MMSNAKLKFIVAAGRFAVRIEPKVIQLPQNRVDLIFEISEGPTTGVRAIKFPWQSRVSVTMNCAALC